MAKSVIKRCKDIFSTSIGLIGKHTFVCNVPATGAFYGYIYLLKYTTGTELENPSLLLVRGDTDEVSISKDLNNQITISSAVKSGNSLTITLSQDVQKFGAGLFWN